MAISQQQLGEYTIHEELGSGGFGIVYRAVYTVLDQTVALKVLKPVLMADPEFVARFKQEAKLAAKLHHSHLVRIINFVEDAGRLGIVSDYLPGGDLKARLAEGRMPLKEAAAILEQVGQALDYMHEREMVHRDVKPSNVLFDAEGQAVLTDFGIVKALHGTQIDAENSGALSYATTTGGAVGTPAYMAPEQIMGEEMDGRVDVYALGIVAYEMVTGTVPFKGPTTRVHISHVQEQPLAPAEVAPGVPPSISKVVLKALEKEPQARYATAGEFTRAFRQALAQAEERWLAQQLAEIDAWIAAGEGFAPALERLELLVQLFPDHQELVDKLEEVRKRSRYDELYEDVRDLWERARERAAEIVALIPHAPDPDQILARLLAERAKPKAAEVPAISPWIPNVAVALVLVSTLVQLLLSGTYADYRGVSYLYQTGSPLVLLLPALAALLIRWWPGELAGRRTLAWGSLAFRLFVMHITSNVFVRPPTNVSTLELIQIAWAGLDLLSVMGLATLLWILTPRRRGTAASVLANLGALAVGVSLISGWVSTPLKTSMGYDFLEGNRFPWWIQDGLVLLPVVALLNSLLLAPSLPGESSTRARRRALASVVVGGLTLGGALGLALIQIRSAAHLYTGALLEDATVGLWLLLAGLALLWGGTSLGALRVLRRTRVE
jgi:serine/threonine protein kinase